MPAKKSTAPLKKWTVRGAWVAGMLAIASFAVEGGEYGTRSLFDQKARQTRLTNEVAQLKHEINSVQKDLNAAQHDNATIERIAREEYGMVRGNKELLFWTGGGRSRSNSTSDDDAARANKPVEKPATKAPTNGAPKSAAKSNAKTAVKAKSE